MIASELAVFRERCAVFNLCGDFRPSPLSILLQKSKKAIL